MPGEKRGERYIDPKREIMRREERTETGRECGMERGGYRANHSRVRERERGGRWLVKLGGSDGGVWCLSPDQQIVCSTPVNTNYSALIKVYSKSLKTPNTSLYLSVRLSSLSPPHFQCGIITLCSQLSSSPKHQTHTYSLFNLDCIFIHSAHTHTHL